MQKQTELPPQPSRTPVLKRCAASSRTPPKECRDALNLELGRYSSILSRTRHLSKMKLSEAPRVDQASSIKEPSPLYSGEALDVVARTTTGSVGDGSQEANAMSTSVEKEA